MKSLILRSSVALTCALSVAACGGGGGSLLLGGTILGLTKPGLVLQNKSGTPLEISAGQTTFAFPDLLGNDEDFDVEIKTQPTAAVCTPTFNKGRTGAYNVTSVVISCVTNSYPLTANVSGLDVDGLVLINGSDRLPVPANTTSLPFTNKVFDGSPYGVTILNQPTGRTCSVAAGNGTMTGPATVQVTCV